MSRNIAFQKSRNKHVKSSCNKVRQNAKQAQNVTLSDGSDNNACTVRFNEAKGRKQYGAM